MPINSKYLYYLEDTPKHHGLLEDIVAEAGREAREAAMENEIPVTFLSGQRILRVVDDNKVVELKRLKKIPRKVEEGSTTEL